MRAEIIGLLLTDNDVDDQDASSTAAAMLPVFRPTYLGLQQLSPILRMIYNVVLVFPSHMRHAFPFMAAGSPFGGPKRSSQRRNLALHAVSLEALGLTPPEAAGL